MSFDTATPYIACYILLEQDSKFAFLKRANTGWRDNYYGLPAGKVEKNESFRAGAIREAKEEVGITLLDKNLHHVLTCHRNEDGNQWVDVMFRCQIWSGEVINNEPHMSSELTWFSLDELPENIIPSLGYMLEQFKLGKTYCEYGWQPAAV